MLNEITQHLSGKIYADKGYIGRELFSKLWQRGLHLIPIRLNIDTRLIARADGADAIWIVD